MYEVVQSSKLDEYATSVPADEVRTAVERLLADPSFRASERNRRFLRFVIDETLAGRGHRIKSYLIAVEVFGRGVHFDAETDPIVRIEATRLRAALEAYYSGPGRDETIRIGLPKGHYVPTFEAAHSAEEVALSAPEPLPFARHWSHRFQLHAALLLAVLALTGIPLAGFLLHGFLDPVLPDPQAATLRVNPTVAVTNQPTENLGAQGLSQSLQLALVRIPGSRILWVPPDVAPDTTASVTPLGMAGIYDVSTTIRIDHATLRVVWWLSDAATGEVIQADFVDREAKGGSTIAAEDEVAEVIASRFAALMDNSLLEKQHDAGHAR
jgi:TolB-like protein